MEFYSVYILSSLPYAFEKFLWIIKFNMILKLEGLIFRLQLKHYYHGFRKIKYSKRKFSMFLDKRKKEE